MNSFIVDMATIVYVTCVFVTLLSVLSTTGSLDECPPWFTWDNKSLQCACSDTMEYEIMYTCDQRRQILFLQLGYCAFQDSTTNGTVVAACPYVFPDHLIVDERIPLPNKSSELNQFICGNLNRDIGTHLCGRCTNGTGPSIYSAGNQCVSCSAVNIVYYLLLQYLPTTILFVAIIVFRINVTSAPMAHYVLFCDIIVLFFRSSVGAQPKYFSIFIKPVLVLNAIWSFDPLYFVSPPICVSKHIQEIYIPFLDTVAAFYPFILLLLTYVGIELHAHDCKPVVHLWTLIHKPFVRFRKTWDPNASVIQAFATLFFLSYAKFVLVVYEAAVMSNVINEQGHVVTRLSYIDPSVHFFSQKYYHLLILSILITFLIILPPILLLIVYPTCLFKKISTCLKPRCNVSIQTFVDTLHGCYKDGTNGTRDYRAVSGYLLVVFAFFPTVFITTFALYVRSMILPSLVSIVFFFVLTVACALLKPYKHGTANMSGVILPAILGSTAVNIAVLEIFKSNTIMTCVTLVIICVTLSLPHCVFYGYIVYRLGKLLKQYCCKTREMEDSVDERLPCRLTNNTRYSQLNEVSCND